MLFSPPAATAFRKTVCCASVFLLGLLILCPTAAHAQGSPGVDQTGTGGRHTIQGRIYFPSGRRTDARIKVTLQSLNGGALSVLSDGNGSFGFRGLNPGTYTVIVDGGDDYETVSEPVYIETDGASDRRGTTMPPVTRLYTVQISLQPKSSSAPKAGLVNAALASVPQAARELYHKAQESARADNHEKAIEQLNEAIALYPDFPIALNQLGIQYLMVRRADKAAEALKGAVKFAPNEFEPRLNYGIALLQQKKLAEAEEQLRIAVGKNRTVATGHFYLGKVLAIQRKLDEAEKELQTAIIINADEMGPAHRYLGGIYLERREYKRAADELDVYLKLVPAAADANQTREKIRELRTKSYPVNFQPTFFED